MKKNLLIVLFTLVLSAGTGGLGCNDQPHPGIEAGNPNVSVKSLRVVPEQTTESYEVNLNDDKTADVSEIGGGDNPAVLTATVPYTLENNLLILKASFSNDHQITLSASFSEGGDLISGRLQVDGSLVNACFEIPGQTASCPSPAQTSATTAQTPAPITFAPQVVGPVKVMDEPTDRSKSEDQSVAIGDGIPSYSVVGPDPNACYCIMVNGFCTACKVPIANLGASQDTGTIKKPALSEVAHGLDLPPDAVLQPAQPLVIGTEDSH